MADSDEEFYEIPIKDQRVYGSGIKRKRIAFVRASAGFASVAPPLVDTKPTLAEQFLSKLNQTQAKDDADLDRSGSTPLPVCELCKQPMRDSNNANGVPHEATITHQLALKHSYGPATINRSSRGLPYMEAQGWDPDARQGLGASGEGMLYPIEAKKRRERLGLGLKVKTKAPTKPNSSVQKAQNLNARQIRKLEMEERQRADKMKDLFYRDDKVENLLNSIEENPSKSKKDLGEGSRGQQLKGF